MKILSYYIFLLLMINFKSYSQTLDISKIDETIKIEMSSLTIEEQKKINDQVDQFMNLSTNEQMQLLDQELSNAGETIASESDTESDGEKIDYISRLSSELQQSEEMQDFIRDIPFLEFSIKKLNDSPLKIKMQFELATAYLIIYETNKAFSLFTEILSSKHTSKHMASEAKLNLANIYEMNNTEEDDEIAINLYKSILANPFDATKETRTTAEQRLDFLLYDHDVSEIKEASQLESLTMLILQIEQKLQQNPYLAKNVIKRKLIEAYEFFDPYYKDLLNEREKLRIKNEKNNEEKLKDKQDYITQLTRMIEALTDINNKLK